MSRADFLAVNNVCGQTLLKLVSRANAIVAELLRLSDFIPVEFQNTDQSVNKYAELIFDFAYFKVIDQWDTKIEANERLLDLDDELKENYMEILTRFYLLFESVYRYAVDLNRYVEDLEDGNFIQQNLESVFNNLDGKQLLVEALYLYGVVLMLIDYKIESSTRERLLVAYYRYSGRRSSADSNIDDVCRLLRSTEFVKTVKRPPGYPENYFKRISMNPLYVSMAIGRLRSEDIYNQILTFPLPEHRSTALSQQGAMLCVTLFFQPEILQCQGSVMREIVDKFFPDNWVVNIHMGHRANLVDIWEPYKAARSALSNVLALQSVKHLVGKYGTELIDLNVGLLKYIDEGVVNDEFILNNINKAINSFRRCNVVLKWLMLHVAPLKTEIELTKKCGQLRDVVLSDQRINMQTLFQLLLNTAQFEFSVKEKLKDLLSGKTHKCQQMQKELAGRFTELANVFSGATPLFRIDKNDKLRDIFSDFCNQLAILSFDDEPNAGRNLVQLMTAVEEVQEIYGLDNNAQVRQFISDIRQMMHQLLRTLHLNESTLVQMQIICDFSYAWEVIENYTELMQKGIRQNPSMPMKLRATFLKLSSAMDLPLMRIQQASSPDLLSVSQFYSKNLVLYFRRVLQITPETVFSLLAKIVDIRTSKVKELPTRLDKDKLKEFARLDDRYEIARLTHSISVLAEGILAMKATAVGVIKVDPKKLLEDGIRKELVKNVSTALNQTLKFVAKSKQSELVPRLKSLANQLEAYRLSFEYISDYIGLSGLKIWLEEFSRIVNYNVEQECNSYLRHKVQDHESLYQSTLIPIPRFEKIDNNFGFIGRLADEILNVTDVKNTIYVDHANAWYDSKTKKEGVNVQLFKVIMASIKNVGVSGLDRLFSFMITEHLQTVIQCYKKDILSSEASVSFLTNAEKVLEGGDAVPGQPQKFYGSLSSKFSKSFHVISSYLSKIGQLQILRQNLTRELNIVCKFESKFYEDALQTLNKAVMLDIKSLEKNGDEDASNIFNDTPLLSEVAVHLESAGIADPLLKIYLMPHLSPSPFCLFAFALILSQISKFAFVKTVGLVSKKPLDTLDGVPFVVGFCTLVRQIGSGAHEKFIAYMGHALQSFCNNSLSSTKSSLPADFHPLIIFLLEFVNCYGVNRTIVEKYVSRVLLDEHEAFS